MWEGKWQVVWSPTTHMPRVLMQTQIITPKGEWMTHVRCNWINVMFSMFVYEATEDHGGIIFGNRSILLIKWFNLGGWWFCDSSGFSFINVFLGEEPNASSVDLLILLNKITWRWCQWPLFWRIQSHYLWTASCPYFWSHISETQVIANSRSSSTNSWWS